ncbi:MAG: hypothetical protein AAFV07_19945 [Bacteroidota bacterium]
MKTSFVFFLTWLLLGWISHVAAQDRMQDLEVWLDSLATEVPALLEPTTISLRDASLAEYVRAIGIEHQINLYIEDTPPTVNLTTSLINEPVKSVFLFICKHFDYTLTQTGTILEFIPATTPPDPEPEKEALKIRFEEGMLSVDLERDSLFAVIREISAQTGQKIITRPGAEGLLTAFLPPTPLDTALEALFLANGYRVQRQRKGYYLVSPFGGSEIPRTPPKPTTQSPSNPQGRLDFIVESYTDGDAAYISINAENADLAALRL